MFDIVVKELHIHNPGVDELEEYLARLEANLKECLMSTKEEVLAAVAAEKAEVAGKVAELEAKIDQLIEDQDGASADDLEEIKLAVQGIFTPTAGVPV